MSFSLRKRRTSAVAEPAAAPAVTATEAPAETAAHIEAIRETIDLLEADLAAMIRDVQQAAGAVRHGVDDTARALALIRERSDALAGKSRSAKDDAVQLAAATEEFAASSREILSNRRPPISETSPD